MWSGLESKSWDAESPSSMSLSSSIYVCICIIMHHKESAKQKTLRLVGPIEPNRPTPRFFSRGYKYVWSYFSYLKELKFCVLHANSHCCILKTLCGERTAKDFINILISDKNYSWNINQTWPLTMTFFRAKTETTSVYNSLGVPFSLTRDKHESRSIKCVQSTVQVLMTHYSNTKIYVYLYLSNNKIFLFLFWFVFSGHLLNTITM